MKKFLAFAIIGLFITMAAYFSSCKSKKDEPKVSGDSDSLKAMVERGDYLVNHVAGCLDCHSKRDFTKYSGPVMPGTEGGGGFLFDQKLAGVPGMVYSRNITPDNETGIGTWTDEEILKALTQGISKNGDTLFPIMPYVAYNHLPKKELMSMIAYIRTLKPISNKVPARQLMMPMTMMYPGPALQPSIDGNVMPSPSDKVAYGGYLVEMAECGTCHTPMTPQGPDMSKRFSGGWTFDVGSFKVTSANITQDSATGIGLWTEAQFLDKFIKYREEKNYNFNPGKENTIMPLTIMAGMTDDDLKAIHAFMKTVKPISNKVEKYPK
jgi:hypothetical protein